VGVERREPGEDAVERGQIAVDVPDGDGPSRHRSGAVAEARGANPDLVARLRAKDGHVVPGGGLIAGHGLGIDFDAADVLGGVLMDDVEDAHGEG